MPPKPPPYRLVYRAFDQVDFDPVKSDQVFELRGFDLGYASRVFPGLVLEQEDTRKYNERRYRALGEIAGDLLAVVYAPEARACRLITAWRADRYEWEMWLDAIR